MGNQIGSDEKPMTFRKSIYGKSDGGKGARPRINTIKAGSKGGNSGQWSARKAQMLAKQYKAAGGGYK